MAEFSLPVGWQVIQFLILFSVFALSDLAPTVVGQVTGKQSQRQSLQCSRVIRECIGFKAYGRVVRKQNWEEREVKLCFRVSGGLS